MIPMKYNIHYQQFKPIVPFNRVVLKDFKKKFDQPQLYHNDIPKQLNGLTAVWISCYSVRPN